MKKITMTLITAIVLAGSIFAQESISSFPAKPAPKEFLEIGVGYGSITMIETDSPKSKQEIGGLGLQIGHYEELAKILGFQTNFFFSLPTSIEYTTGSRTVDLLDTTSISSPMMMNANFMLMLSLPLGFLNIRAGAGISYTLYTQKKPELFNQFLAVPIEGDVIFKMGSDLYIKAGLDVEIVFKQWQHKGSKTTDLDGYDSYIVIPHLAAGISF